MAHRASCTLLLERWIWEEVDGSRCHRANCTLLVGSSFCWPFQPSSTPIPLSLTPPQVPPLSNCTLRGTVATGVVMWSQNVAYTIVDACSNRPKTFDTTVNFEANGVVMTQSALDVTFEQCSPPDTSVCRPASPVPPPAQTCSSNVQCNAAGFTGNCCPKDDGTYMLCCAQVRDGGGENGRVRSNHARCCPSHRFPPLSRPSPTPSATPPPTPASTTPFALPPPTCTRRAAEG